MSTETSFRNVDDSTSELFFGITRKIALPFTISFKLVNNEKQKKLIQLNKIPDVYAFLTNMEVLVTFNEDYMNVMDEQSIEILIQQELDRLHCDLNSGKIKISKPELSTSVGVIKKYGIDEVAKANKLEELLKEQKEDAAKDLANEITDAQWEQSLDNPANSILSDDTEFMN